MARAMIEGEPSDSAEGLSSMAGTIIEDESSDSSEGLSSMARAMTEAEPDGLPGTRVTKWAMALLLEIPVWYRQ